MKYGLCPRCGGSIPNNVTPNAYPGARSRVDNETMICSPCGRDEAMFNFTNRDVPLTPVNLPVFDEKAD